MNDPKSIYHARYEITNKVLQRYAQFKNQSIGKAIKKPELEFIKEHGDEFRDEFVMLSNGDNELTEYLTKVFLYRILTSNRVVQKVPFCISLCFVYNSFCHSNQLLIRE